MRHNPAYIIPGDVQNLQILCLFEIIGTLESKNCRCSGREMFCKKDDLKKIQNLHENTLAGVGSFACRP